MRYRKARVSYGRIGVTGRLGTADLCLSTGALFTHLSYRHHRD